MNVLLINAHHRYPGWSEGSLNASAMTMMQDFFTARGDVVTTTIIDHGYDPADQARKHLEADLVVLQTPVNWFGAPWTWKKYIDDTFNVGLQEQTMLTGDGRTRSDATKPYGSGGLMQGKKFMFSATWNAPAAAFSNDDSPVFRGLSADEALSELAASYYFTGFDVLPAYHIYDVFKNPRNDEGLAGLIEHLNKVLDTTGAS
ncbi:NAD(P)H-dependent oxidoreductase [Actinomyces timonensis]|uniref:NAD(P)H-dependent oxidoreductase n=1 Tax=Actinomyces timonensis TaxID=1288391 RepID=A0AAU8N3F3_9ACTO